MNRLILAVALAAGCSLASSAPAFAAAAAKNYDCSKPGNANKARCKNAAKPVAKAAPTKAAPAKATPAKAAVAAPKPVATKPAAAPRNYDCSKPGNANKAQCKNPAKPVAKAAPAASKSAPAAKPAPAKAAPAAPKPAPKAAAAPAPRKTKAAPASNEDHNPAGAIAQCKDGTYSHAKVRSGACSRHGGVAKWS